ncbi:helix-turn-helix domain-containing protein [Metasolibacillus sp.]|uniref:helix-turn-helix domain-containing protein n=1 Tax=Metasolibacillus sp. TaxID=2703680 RepID=UPI0025F3A9A0|nr:helix-turn-helix domain-containing protein [Metasolibacillus sp.]MCT6925419.1 helix-turn-helix domain-containing protein [Metasolibacillus sp.]MCT6941554.1 helix-turn-helix domain-containing protein [Metasolibacillus sp.]
MAVFDYLEQYATFQSVEDMDKSVEGHMAEHYFNLTESERAIVFMLASRSLAYPGACHLKADTIATKLNISAKTVYRAVKKLNELGIIKKVTTIRDKNGGQGANVYVILPYVPPQMSERENANTSDNNAVCEPSTENQPSISFNLKNNLLNNTYATQASAQKSVDDNKPLKTKEQTPYQQLKSLVMSVLGDSKLASKMYGIYLAQNKNAIIPTSFENVIEAAKHTLNAYKRKYNSANPVDSITGYFNNTLRNIACKASEMACKELLNSSWLDSLDKAYEDHEMSYYEL